MSWNFFDCVILSRKIEYANKNVYIFIIYLHIYSFDMLVRYRNNRENF